MASRSISYRELRNTPGRVFERLAAGEPLTLSADGDEKAVIIPVVDGDVDTTLDAYRRGRALLAMARLQAAARRSGAAELGVAEIDAETQAVRRNRRLRETAE